MSHVQSSTRAIHAGLLKWDAVTPGQARRFNEERAPSPCKQAPEFLQGLPPIDIDYAPREAITKKLKALIIKYSYAEAFEGAIKTVCQQQIQELDRVHTLSQFFIISSMLL